VVLGRQCHRSRERLLNGAVGEEGRVNSCQIVWPSERTSSPIQKFKSPIREGLYSSIYTSIIIRHITYNLVDDSQGPGPLLQRLELGTAQQLGHGSRPHINILIYRSLKCSNSSEGSLVVSATTHFQFKNLSLTFTRFWRPYERKHTLLFWQ